MDIKLIFFVLSFGLVLAAYVPYFRGMFRGETKPHAYTWLIWAITTGIGAAGTWYGNGGLPAITFAVAACITFLIFLLSFKYGTRNITTGDTITLIAALCAVLIWIGLDNPLLSVIVGISIDIIGYWPSVRKTYIEPWSESVWAWILWIFAPAFSFLALETYNALTTMYYIPLAIVNTAFVLLILARRKAVLKPVPK